MVIYKTNNIPCDHSEIVFIKADKVSHIEVIEPKICLEKCGEQPCTYLCPTHVFGWTTDGVRVDYERCFECGACHFFCPQKNIKWEYPKAGYGVIRKY
jgi:ferredoxin like protein